MSQLAITLLLVVLALPVLQPAEQPAQVWAVPSVQKVRPDDRPEASNLVWTSESKTVAVAGARDEHVPFQIVISTPPPPTRYDAAAAGFQVEISDLTSTAGRIPRDRVSLYFEHVVLCYARSSPVGATGFWPDALAPLSGPFGMSSEFRSAVRNRAVWIDIHVPAEAAAGSYSGTLRVTRNGSPVDQLKVSLRVFDFALPREPHLITYVGVSARNLARAYGLAPDSAEMKNLLRKYYDFLYANRMEPWFHEMLQPRIREATGGDVIVEFDADAYAHYMNNLKTRRVILEASPRELEARGKYAEFSEPFNRRARSYLRQVHDHFQRNGWLPRLVINSPIDEPNTAQQYADTRRWAALVHEAAPGVPFLVTESPVPDRPEWGTLSGHANNFSVHGNELNRREVKKAIREEQSKGGEVTWYISCDQVYPQPNYFIDAPAMDPVMVPWITHRYGMNGILYWDIAYWPQTPDPWIDPVTFLSGFLCSEGFVLNGEGSLIYPGNRARRYTGQKDVDGPVSSIRFELLREGIEDFEYLWLLKSLGDGEFAERAAQSMVIDVSTFSRNVEDLFAIRTVMAERIEALARKTPAR